MNLLFCLYIVLLCDIIATRGVKVAKYKKGKIVSGLVTGVESYGIFVSLDDFYSGLIHISEISNNFVRNANEFVNVGETIFVKILDVDDDTGHVKLSIKNFNYRPNKNKKCKIIETGAGFQPLADQLDDWVDKKIKEIKKN